MTQLFQRWLVTTHRTQYLLSKLESFDNNYLLTRAAIRFLFPLLSNLSLPSKGITNFIHTHFYRTITISTFIGVFLGSLPSPATTIRRDFRLNCSNNTVDRNNFLSVLQPRLSNPFFLAILHPRRNRNSEITGTVVFFLRFDREIQFS